MSYKTTSAKVSNFRYSLCLALVGFTKSRPKDRTTRQMVKCGPRVHVKIVQ